MNNNMLKNKKTSMKIELYDFLCCHSPMYNDLISAIEDLKIYPDFHKITDVTEIFKITNKPPALFIDGTLVSEGDYLTKDKIIEILK